jgi:hypothetical protein
VNPQVIAKLVAGIISDPASFDTFLLLEPSMSFAGADKQNIANQIAAGASQNAALINKVTAWMSTNGFKQTITYSYIKA